MSETWTIGELADLAADLLGSTPPVSGRVRDVPNERLIRWYTTIGLVDPPLTRRGRVARYGRRHLLQLVAIKRRQSDGLSIAAIQAELAGATDAMLQRIAGLPGPAPEAEDGETTLDTDRDTGPGIGAERGPEIGPEMGLEMGTERGTERRAQPTSAGGRGRFWTAHPADLSAAQPAAQPRPADGAVRPDAAPALVPVAASAAAVNSLDLVVGVRLAPGVTVLLDGAGRSPDGAELAALRRAAGPLLATLARLGLTAAGAGLAEIADYLPDAEGMTP